MTMHSYITEIKDTELRIFQYHFASKQLFKLPIEPYEHLSTDEMIELCNKFNRDIAKSGLTYYTQLVNVEPD